MLEGPEFDDQKLIACLQRSYGLSIVEVKFLPLGADPHTAVYRALTEDACDYFVKLRSGSFVEASVTLPQSLSEGGLEHIIAPLRDKTGALWATLGAFTVIVYPFVTGRSGYEVTLTEGNWRDLGRTLRRLHTLNVPPALRQLLRRETFSGAEREKVTTFLSRLGGAKFSNPAAAQLAGYLQAKGADILELVRRADDLAQRLRGQTLEWAICHADLHAGNLLLDGDNRFYIVDWDEPILAPKERDLMFIGGGQGFVGRTPEEEERFFYLGYGQAQLDLTALAYYRFERIVQDTAVYCDELTAPTSSAAALEQSLNYLKANFQPGGTVARAYAVPP